MEKRQKKRLLFRFGILALTTVLILGAVLAVLPSIRRDVSEESRAAIRDAVIRAAVECYAVEGAYPESLTHLEEHYGLIINHSDFIIVYDVFASNLLPQVQVLVRGEE